MKKAVSFLFIALMLIASVCVSAHAEEYSIDELYFDIPYDCFVECDVDENYYYAWGFEGVNDDIKLTVVEYDNYNGQLFYYWDLQDVAQFYEENLCLYPADYAIESIQSFYVSNSSDGFIIDGMVNIGGEKHFFEIYLYVTSEYFYIFEFTSPEEDFLGYMGVADVLNSIYVTPYDSTDNHVTSSSSGDDFFELLGPIFIVIFSSFAFVFKNFVKNKKEPEKSSDTNKTQPSPVNIKLPTTKFELNGKNINAFNERFNVGSKDDNFALKELERERKEREKMFK